MQRVTAVLSVNENKSIVTAWIPRFLVALLFCAAMLARPAAAQIGQQFVGHIEDSAHASISGASVTVHNEGTAEDVAVKATGAGDYTVPYLKTGFYTITVDMAGFKSISKTHIQLNTDQTSKIDFVLPVGNVTENVTVNSAGSQIDLSKADRGEIIDAETVQEMPTDGRNVLELFELSPGTLNNHPPLYTRPQDNVVGDLYANGGAVVGAGAAVQENIDGATNDNANGYLGYPAPLDSVAEFKTVLNPYDASYGRAGGGAIDISLKSGTNKVHGDLYEYARRAFLDANTYITDFNQSLYNQSTNKCPALPAVQPSGCRNPPIISSHKRDQFGLEVDGPVYIPHLYNGKDKTFFTIQWEQAYENLPNASATINSVPDPDWVAGNFGSTPTLPGGAQYFATPTVVAAGAPPNSKNLRNLCAGSPGGCDLPLGIYDPYLGVLSNVVDPNDGNKKYARQQFPGNNCGDLSGAPIICLIPQNPNDPSQAVGRAIAQIYNTITPNYNPGPGYAPYQNNFFFNAEEYDLTRNGLVKIDHNFGPRDRGTVRWEGFERFAFNPNEGLPATNPGNQVTFEAQPKDNNFAIDEIHTFSPNLIVDTKITLLNERQGSFSGSRDPNILTELGFSQHYISNSFFTNIFPGISGTGEIGLGGGPLVNNISHNLAIQPSFTLIRGRHTIRGGLDIRLYQYANPGGGSGAPSLSFSGSTTSHYVNGSSEAAGFSSASGLASLLLGDPSGAYIKYSVDVFDSQHYYGFWAQDDWKITPKLTLNFGLRYDLLGARTERHNKLNYAFDTTDVSPIDAELPSHAGLSGPLMGGIRFAGVNGAPRGAYATNLLDIQPRFGAAYAFSSRTSLRLGFGEEFINDELNDSENGFSSSATGYTSSYIDGDPASVCGAATITYNTCPYGHANDPFPSYVKPTGSSLGLATTPGSSVNFTDPNYKVPSLWQYSVSLEQLLTRRDTLEIAFSGSRAYNVTDSLQLNNVSAAYNARCDIERGGDRQLCDNSSASNVPNPFYHVPAFLGTSYYTNSTINNGNLTRPFPQFTGVSQDNSPFLHTWYNSMQVSAAHNVSRSLTAHASYTYSKTMKAGNVIDSTNGVFGRAIAANDTPNVITFSAVYYAPFGRGKTFFGNTNRITDALIGGWEIAPLYVYTEGKPQNIGNNWEYAAGPLAVKPHDLPPDATHNYIRVQGMTPCVAYRDTDTDLLDYGPSYAANNCTAPRLIAEPNGYAIPKNMVYSGVRLFSYHEFDASLSKRFAWNERVNLQLRLDAFNVLNHPNFTNSTYSTSQTSIDFGTFAKNNNPYNPPRDLQISGKITF